MSASQKAVDRTGENHPMFGLTGKLVLYMGETDLKEPENLPKKLKFFTKNKINTLFSNLSMQLLEP